MKDQDTKYVQLQGLSEEELNQSPEIQHAAKTLQQGELVAFPTETVYGLGADARSEQAVQAIFKAKGRPSDNPLIVHYAEITQLQRDFPSLPPQAEKLMKAFWPGPMTLVLPDNSGFAPQVTADLSTVAVRIPRHPLATALLRRAGIPIAAPSANRSGRPSPTQAEHVYADLQGRISCLLDGGASEFGIESTVIDVTQPVPVVLRPGSITLEDIIHVLGEAIDGSSLPQNHQVPRAPGMKYRHYAPRAELLLCTGTLPEMTAKIKRVALEEMKKGKRVGILTTEENQAAYSADLVFACGYRNIPKTVARLLYKGLHLFDQKGMDLILTETFPEQGSYVAVMNRLKKAANNHSID